MYTTFGIRAGGQADCCEHEHETYDEAQKCLVAHQNELRKSYKVTVRRVIEVESLDDLFEAAELY